MTWKSWIGPAVLIFVSGILAALIAAMPDSKWDKAVVLRICRDGTPILRLANGELWARRSGFVSYRVEDMQTVCG